MALDATTVLVVEDDPMVREFLVRALAHFGADATAVSDGTAAIAALAATTFCAVFIDGLLPDMHGVELAHLMIDGAAPGVPLCIISGALASDVPMRAGVAALTKPTRPSVLAATLAVLVQSGRATPPASERRAVLDDLASTFSVFP